MNTKIEDINLKNLDANQLKELKIDIINTNDLIRIPAALLPDVSYDNYFFVSYSSKDYKMVYTDIIKIQNAGVNTWYDRDMPAGFNWKQIAVKYMSPYSCVGVLFYLSENSLTSGSVLEEIAYAKKLNKLCICINLPFENDYLYREKSTRGQTYSVLEMLDILKENKKITKSIAKKIKSLFDKNERFLDFFNHESQRAEQINGSIKQAPLIKYTLAKRKYVIETVNDVNALSINKNDFQMRRAHEYEIAACAFSNMRNLESVDLSIFKKLDIGAHAFFGCKMLKNVKNSEAIEYIDDGAFEKCSSLEEISLNKAQSIYNQVFKDCTKLKKVTIGEECTDIGYECFSGCTSLKSLILPNSLFHLGDEAFLGCKNLLTMSIPNNVKEMGDGVFCDCKKLEHISLPETLKEITGSMFEKCSSLEEISFSKHLKEIGDFAFSECTYLDNIVLPDGFKKLGDEAFYKCVNLSKISLPDSLEIVGDGCFESCYSLQTIELPKSLKKLGDEAFAYSGLNKIIYHGLYQNFISILHNDCFKGCQEDIVVRCEDGVFIIRSQMARSIRDIY